MQTHRITVVPSYVVRSYTETGQYSQVQTPQASNITGDSHEDEDEHSDKDYDYDDFEECVDPEMPMEIKTVRAQISKKP